MILWIGSPIILSSPPSSNATSDPTTPKETWRMRSKLSGWRTINGWWNILLISITLQPESPGVILLSNTNCTKDYWIGSRIKFLGLENHLPSPECTNWFSKLMWATGNINLKFSRNPRSPITSLVNRSPTSPLIPQHLCQKINPPTTNPPLLLLTRGPIPTCPVPPDKTRSPTSPINSERMANSPLRNALADSPTTFACFAEALDTRWVNVRKTPPPLPKQRPEQLILRKDRPLLWTFWKNRVQLWWLCMDQELCWTPLCTHRVKTQHICSFLQFLNNSSNF